MTYRERHKGAPGTHLWVKNCCQIHVFGVIYPCYANRADKLTPVLGEQRAGVIVLYGRVSGYDQQEDLQRQVQQLEHWALATRTGQKTLTLTDIGSGLNITRKSLQKLLTMV